MSDETFPVLYILMRGDLESMNPGKAMAQASHASNAFWKRMNDSFLDSEGKSNTPIQDLANKWHLETDQGFGTVLVLEVNEIEMRTAVEIGNKLGYACDVIHDPTYPVIDGECCHFLPIDTCAYIFLEKSDLIGQSILQNFPLHP